MNWKGLFAPVRNMLPEEAERFMAERSAGDYQLLDVRQPREYGAGHLPGALLIPIRELPERLEELDRTKPLLVYCAVGGRSRAAAQLLSGRDFPRVFNLAGGIKAWHGRRAAGPAEAGLELLSVAGEYEDAVGLAYAMEEGLGEFYRLLAAESDDPVEKELYRRLMGFEDLHKARLLAEYQARHGKDRFPAKEGSEIVEGGRNIRELLQGLAGSLHGKEAILDLAMSLETQALDLYSRMARHSEGLEAGEVFLRLADEERAHLSLLAEELDRLL